MYIASIFINKGESLLKIKTMKNILAKSIENGNVYLIDHTEKVVDIIKKICNSDIVVGAGKLHDIGKIINTTQNFYKTGKKHKFKYTHNIIGWAFINAWINDSNSEAIANLVLWHHPNDNNCEDLSIPEILDEISEEDLNMMKEFVSYQGFKINDVSKEFNTYETKFSKVDNYLRTVLILSDSCVSANISHDNLNKKTTKIDLSDINTHFINSDRTKEQLEIVKSIKDNNTVLIKAPAGYGKTVIGMLWSLRRDKKLIWVCPTNTIAESVYRNIISDMEMMNLKNISVELFLSSERKDYNKIEPEDFNSDIIVTNIDNFIKPTINNSYSKRSMFIYNCDVIFDEVHILNNMSCALYEAFNNIMIKRHSLNDITTLLLTATPTVFMFEKAGGNNIIVLPNMKEHYKPIHDKIYNIEFVSDKELANSIKSLNSNEFVLFSNTVIETQNEYKQYNRDKLISHGRYLDKEKSNKKEQVFKNYGKNTTKKELAVFTNEILTTSCDYSVKNMFIVMPTIVSFYQSLGRINRWGNDNISKIFIIEKNDYLNRTYLDKEFGLQREFVSDFKIWVSKNTNITLEKLYMFYNEFVYKNKRRFEKVAFEYLNESKKHLESIYPKRQKDKSDKKIAGANKLRTTDTNEIYISVIDNITKERITVPFSIRFDKTLTFNENEKTQNNQIKELKKMGIFNKYQKITSDTFYKEAKDYDKPYIVFNYYYCSELGLVKN